MKQLMLQLKNLSIKTKDVFVYVDNNEHKKAKGVNKNVVATIGHNEYIDVLLNKKCLRHSMNRFQRKIIK